MSGTDSFAKTPLKAAQAPLVMAKKSHVDFVREIDMVGCCSRMLGSLLVCGGSEVEARNAGSGPPRA